MSQFLHVLFLLLFTIGLYSCSRDKETYYFFAVEQEFKIEMKEYFKEGKRGLFFDIETFTGYECENVEIEAVATQQDGNIRIEIKGISRPQNCNIGGTYIAQKRILLENVEDSYELSIIVGKTIYNKGKLLLENDEFVIKFEAPTVGVHFKEMKLKKMPEKAIWGRFYTNQASAINIYRGLKNRFHEFNCRPVELETGNYTDFKVSEDDNIQWKESVNESHEQSFMYQYDGDDINLLGNIIAQFDSLHSNYDYKYSIFVYNGDVY